MSDANLTQISPPASVAQVAGTVVMRHPSTGAVTLGAVTATSFVGDGSGLTNLPGGGGVTLPIAQSDVTGLVAALAGKASATHTHAESDVTGLTAALAGKAASVHTHVQSDVTGLVADLASKASAATLSSHTSNTSNPHSVTAAQVGAYTTGAIDTIVAALQSDIAGTFAYAETVGTDLSDHTANTSNPHGVTKSQVGLGSVDNTSDATKNAATVTLTNKTISADNNTLSGIAASSFVLSNASGNIDGAAAQKAIPAGVVVGTTDTQTLTNKTLTAPTMTGAVVVGSGGTLSVGGGFTSSGYMATFLAASGDTAVQLARPANTANVYFALNPAGAYSSSNLSWSFGLFASSNSYAIAGWNGAQTNNFLELTNDYALNMSGRSSTTPNCLMLSLSNSWVDATHATRKARTDIYANDTTTRLAIRLEGTGSAAAIGFLGASAVARQSIGAAATDAASTQTLVNNIRTALINLGLCSA